MDYTPKELENLAKMDSLLARLQACADVRVAALERMKIATTGLEMQRQVKAIKVTRDLVVTLYSPLPQPKSRPRTRPEPKPDTPLETPAPRPEPANSWDSMDRAITSLLNSLPPAPKPAPARRPELVPALETKGFDLPSPPHLLDGEVAASAAKQTEGSALAEKPSPAPNFPATDSLQSLQIEASSQAIELINSATHDCAQWAGIWPDGANFTAEEPNWRRHTLTTPLIIDLTQGDLAAPVRQEILNRANAIARACGRRDGLTLDGYLYREHMPDLWTLSNNLGTGNQQAAPGETPGPECLPWWIVRKPPPFQPT